MKKELNRKRANKVLTSLRFWTLCLLLTVGAPLPLLLRAQTKPNVQGASAQVQPTPAAPPQNNSGPKLNLQLAPLGRETRSLSSFAPIAKKVEPSVVTVYSTKMVRESRNPLSNDPLFRRFFGPGTEDDNDDQDNSPPSKGAPPRQRQEQSLGSGVIVTSDGYILSNSHVVDGADEIKVSLPDGKTEYTAKVIGVDEPTDISVLKIDATNLAAIAITDSSTLQVGDVVLAVGNPFGVGQTVTMGIVSAMGRGGFGITDYEDFIQTDASINPGNSGGALVDVEGRLVGIPTAILSRTGGNVGIGFAVPVNMARSVMDAIIRNGKVVRGYLGVYVQSISPQLQQAFHLPNQNGALVSGVAPNSPAAAAGLREGDVILALNNQPVSDSRHLRLLISQNAPKSKADLKVMRDGQEKTLTATLGELPSEQVAKVPQKKPEPTGRKVEGELGLRVRDLDPTMAQELKLPSNVKGALVEAVQRNSPAFSAGLRPGDIIQEVNRKPVKNAQEVVNLAKPVNGQVLLRVWSKGGSRFVVVEVGKKEK